MCSANFKMSACHPAGKDANGNHRKELWPPPEHSAPPSFEENNPLMKLLIGVGSLQKDILEDYLLLTNRIYLHLCPAYCLVPPKAKHKSCSEKVCKMEFGKASAPGKPFTVGACLGERSLPVFVSRDGQVPHTYLLI